MPPSPDPPSHTPVPQPQSESPIEATVQAQAWIVISAEQGVTVSVQETDQRVTRICVEWSSLADLEADDDEDMHVANQALTNWNTVAGRQFQLDEDKWIEANSGQGHRFETEVVTTFRTAVELYVDTATPILEDRLVKTIVRLLQQQLPMSAVEYARLFGCVMQVEFSPYASVERIPVGDGQYRLETDDGWATLPAYRVPVPMEALEPILLAFERQLTPQVMSQTGKGIRLCLT